MNFYDYISSQHFHSDCECCAVVQDETVPILKATLEEVFPPRGVRKTKRLIDFVPVMRAKKIIADGVALIKSIPDEESHRRIAAYLYRIFRGTATREGMINYLVRMGGVDESRAEMIVDDQISKAANRFLVEKWKSRGCKKVRWIHSGAENPRVYHLRRWNGVSGKRNGRPNGLNGYVFNIDKPPVINPKTKERGYPGQMINCHCRLEPIWD